MGRRNKDRWRDKLFQQKLEEEKQGIYGIWKRWEGRDKETVNPEIPNIATTTRVSKIGIIS